MSEKEKKRSIPPSDVEGEACDCRTFSLWLEGFEEVGYSLSALGLGNQLLSITKKDSPPVLVDTRFVKWLVVLDSASLFARMLHVFCTRDKRDVGSLNCEGPQLIRFGGQSQ